MPKSQENQKIKNCLSQKNWKAKKMFMFQNLAKSEKKLSKSGNLPNFDATKTEIKFLIPGAKTVYDRLWLAFTKAQIFWHFDPECPIRIEIDALGYVIG